MTPEITAALVEAYHLNHKPKKLYYTPDGTIFLEHNPASIHASSIGQAGKVEEVDTHDLPLETYKPVVPKSEKAANQSEQVAELKTQLAAFEKELKAKDAELKKLKTDGKA